MTVRDLSKRSDPDRCPNCDRPGVGSDVVEVPLRGTREGVQVIVCAGCGTLYEKRGDG